jgi:hypothetical protein
MAPGTMGSLKSGNGKLSEGRQKWTERGGFCSAAGGAGEEEEPQTICPNATGGNETTSAGFRVCEVKIVTTKHNSKMMTERIVRKLDRNP